MDDVVIFQHFNWYTVTETSWNDQFRLRTKQLAVAIIKAYSSWKKSDEISSLVNNYCEVAPRLQQIIEPCVERVQTENGTQNYVL